MDERLPFTCPICGRKTNHPANELFEGAILICPHCGLRLTLHGCMWEDVKKQIRKSEKTE